MILSEALVLEAVRTFSQKPILRERIISLLLALKMHG